MICIEIGQAQTPPDTSARTTSQPALKYVTKIDGASPKALIKALEAALPLYTQRKDPVSTRAALRSRMDASIEIAREVLKSQGYYAGRVLGRTIASADEPGTAQVLLSINAEKRYEFAPMTLRLKAIEDASVYEALTATAQEVYSTGEPAIASAGLNLAPALLVRLRELGYPFAKLSKQTFRVDHATQLVRPVIDIDTGEKSRIVGLSVSGLSTVEEEYIELLASIEPNSVYDQRTVGGFRDRLIATGLFSGISIRPQPAASQEPSALGEPDLQEVILAVELSEAKLRQISAQFGFSTDQGFSLESAWTHRNFFGQGEILTVRGRFAQLEQGVTTELALPNFKRLDQILTIGLGVAREDTDAFNTLRTTASTILERQLTRRWAVSGGGRLEAQRVEDDLGRRTFYLGAIPLLGRYDGTDDIFDPQDGVRLNIQVTPEAGFGDATLFFVSNDVLLRGYKSLNIAKGTVLAVRARFGTILGEDTQTLPANRRFYSGGGGSIRGYGFQNVGPLDDDGDPFGGRSLIEMGFEARVKVTDTIGVVPFLDFGNVYQSTLPKFSGLQYGAGLGVRYHTDFAPIRFDIGTPLNPRAGDDRIQVYISVGQSF